MSLARQLLRYEKKAIYPSQKILKKTSHQLSVWTSIMKNDTAWFFVFSQNLEIVVRRESYMNTKSILSRVDITVFQWIWRYSNIDTSVFPVFSRHILRVRGNTSVFPIMEYREYHGIPAKLEIVGIAALFPRILWEHCGNTAGIPCRWRGSSKYLFHVAIWTCQICGSKM